MAGEKALEGPAGSRLELWLVRALHPLYLLWALFTNVRFAVVLLVALAAVSLLGVAIPQLPPSLRGDAFAEADWLATQEGRFGPLTDIMWRVGLFDVFRARWFAVLLAVTVVSTASYVVSRVPGLWRNITRPRRRVPDHYFRTAPYRLEVAGGLDPAALERALARARYRVERFPEGEATYLFADRFPWAQAGTLLTHAAIIVFILAAVFSRMDSFSAPLFLAEGGTLPVFPVRSPNQMQVELVDAVGKFDAYGQPLDYRSELVIYRRGEEVKRCVSTVNSPCSYGGYRFYQAAYFGFGAEVQVRDLSTGNVIYRETLALSDGMPSPRVVIRGEDGRTLMDESLVLTNILTDEENVFYFTAVELADGRPLLVGVERPAEGGDWELLVADPVALERPLWQRLAEGEKGSLSGLEVEYRSAGKVPSAFVADFPLPPEVTGGGSGDVLLQMHNVVYGSGNASAGTRVEGTVGEGPPMLTLVGLTPRAVSMRPGERVEIGGYEYTFLGQREFAGIQVRKDRSDYLVWAGAAMVVLGLMLTFWVPRRRLWAKITPARSFFAGQAAQPADYRQEMKRLAREAGAEVPQEQEDDD